MSAPGATDIRRSPLNDCHIAAEARLVPFAGWEMPAQYEGIQTEHEAVRTTAAVFDVSHMGQLISEGPGARSFLQRVLSNDISRLEVGGAQYSVMCRPDGGILDDLFTYRLGDHRYLTVTNAGNHDKDLGWFVAEAGKGVTVTDSQADFAMLAVQGPRARALVARLTGRGLPDRMRVKQQSIEGVEVLACGTGYTGEDGVELLLAPDDAGRVWNALLSVGIKPAGLGARDTLRLEACFHLYGNDIDESRNPIEAGLGWCCKEQTGFVGSEAIGRARAAGTEELLVPFRIEGRGIARSGDAVVGGGTVTSGTMSPSLGTGIGMAYIARDRAVEGERFEIDVRGRRRSASVASKPLYNRAKRELP